MKKIIFIIIIIGILVIPLLPLDPFSDKEIEFVVTKGEGSRDIGYHLEQQGLVRATALFRIYVLTTGRSEKLQAGTYLLSPSMSIIEIVEKLARGDVVKEYITIVEGWNLRDVGWYLEGQGRFQAEELFELVGFPAVDYRIALDLPTPDNFSYDFLLDKPSYVGLEGYLFPDTYAVTAGEELKDIVERILQNFNAKFTLQLRQQAEAQQKSIFEVITMASLLEKEVKSYEDKQTVANVLQKRLDSGMALQVDATVNYITAKADPGVLFEDTRVISSFNTYKYPGLPLGPIANPGIESIRAVLNPIENSYWYYLSTPQGETIFSRTLQEHNIAKAKYLK
ncbi:MAG TPA: endolytic transglycosylase MltG [Candidatus Wildermuthbacteria bacterium]|nr:endolytic transglycosylase MltG [Candidatus Wildermuthbacteria bacterium]